MFNICTDIYFGLWWTNWSGKVSIRPIRRRPPHFWRVKLVFSWKSFITHPCQKKWKLFFRQTHPTPKLNMFYLFFLLLLYLPSDWMFQIKDIQFWHKSCKRRSLEINICDPILQRKSSWLKIWFFQIFCWVQSLAGGWVQSFLYHWLGLLPFLYLLIINALIARRIHRTWKVRMWECE